MKKEEFMIHLKNENTDPELIAYYDELIFDMIEAGEDEESIINGLNQKKVINSFIYTKNKEKLEKESKGNTTKAAWIVVLLLLSTPVTIPLGISLIVTIISLLAVGLSLFVGGLGIFISGILTTINIMTGSYSIGYILINIGIHLVGLSILSILAMFFIKYTMKLLRVIFVKLFTIGQKKEVK